MLTTSNIYAALDTKKAKKKKSKESDKKKKDKKSISAAELERAIFSQPSISITNWADCDDEDEFGAMDDLPPGWAQVSMLVCCARAQRICCADLTLAHLPPRSLNKTEKRQLRRLRRATRSARCCSACRDAWARASPAEHVAAGG
jgi:hypothetical protein